MKYKNIVTTLLLIATIGFIYWILTSEISSTTYRLEVEVVELNQYSSLEKANKITNAEVIVKSTNQEELVRKTTNEQGIATFDVVRGVVDVEISPDSGYLGKKVIKIRGDTRVYLLVTKANEYAKNQTDLQDGQSSLSKPTLGFVFQSRTL